MASTTFVEGMNENSLDNPSRTYNRAEETAEPGAKDNLLEQAQSENPDERKAVAKRLVKLWREATETPSHQRREAQWKANALRRAGVPNVRIQKAENESKWTVWAPPGASSAMPMVNQAATLCRKFVSLLFADPPAPDTIPSSGEDGDRDAAELAERILVDLQAESNLNEVSKARKAFDRASVTGSGFVWYYIDQNGGGRQPKAILASPQAQTADQVPGAEGGQDPGPPYVIRYVKAARDHQDPCPVCGSTEPGHEAEPMLGDQGGPEDQAEASERTNPWATHPTDRPMDSVFPEDPALEGDVSRETPDSLGSTQTGMVCSQCGMPGMPEPRQVQDLTDDPDEAELQWAPRLKSEVVSARNLRFVPHIADDIWDAEGVLKASFISLGQAKAMFPHLADMTPEQITELLRYRPEKAEDLLPSGVKRDLDSLKGDERLVFTLTAVWKESPTYEDGAYMVAIGDQEIGYASPWAFTVHDTRQSLDLPVTQYRQWDEGLDDPYGVGTMTLIGPGNEGRAAQLGGLITHLDRFNNRKIFLPTNSILQPKELELATGTVLSINPGGEPKYEEVPNYPQDSMTLFEILGTDMQNAIGLSDIAQGLEGENVNSGRQAYQIVSQAHAAMSEPKQNVERAYERGCRLQLQLVRAFYTIPQRLRWSTQDGVFREKWFTGADLKSTVDVQVKPGTMTMLTPDAKMNLALQWNSVPGLLKIDQLQGMLFNNVGAMIGVQDDPVRLRIRRQLDSWQEGPPTPTAPVAPPPVPVVPGMPAPAPLPDPAIGQRLAQIFAPTPADSLPAVAEIRLGELMRLMCSTRYERWPVEWKAGVDQEFAKMQMVMMPPPPPMPGTPGGPPGGQAPPPEAQVASPLANPVDPAMPPMDNPMLTHADTGGMAPP